MATALCWVLLLPLLDAFHEGEGEQGAYCEGRLTDLFLKNHVAELEL